LVVLGKAVCDTDGVVTVNRVLQTFDRQWHHGPALALLRLLHIVTLGCRPVGNPPLPALGAALQAYLGHRNVQNTVRYTALAQGRFKGFWRD
jgi:hypothetical protein